MAVTSEREPEMNTEIRELNIDELDLVTGGARLSIPMGGQTKIQFNTDTGCWSVWLAGKETAYGGGPDC
jgi:hypothetical protein